MPDPHRLKNEFQTLLSRPQLSSLFSHLNQFRKRRPPPDADDDAASVAAYAANYLWTRNLLLDPVEVIELRGPLELYRAHDGGASLKSARTLGGCWLERSPAEAIWKATTRYQAQQRFSAYIDFLRASNFILPEWNEMSFIACMTVPAGCSVVVARGRGSWKAMRTPVGGTRPAGAAAIRTPGDVIDNLGMMPTPGIVQCFIPLFNDNWIQPVPYPSAKWPFLT